MQNEIRLIDANALKFKNVAEVNGVLTYVLTADEIDNAPTVLFPLTVKINNNVTDEEIETLKRLMADYKPQVLNLELKRPKGKWIDYSSEGYVECPFCNSATTCEDNKNELHYCWNCGAELV